MNYFKVFCLFFAVLFVSFLITACGQKEKVPMDRLSEDGQYHYSNKDLEFSLAFPQEFVYYQTQRKEGDGYIDIEFFVPTSDTAYRQEVPSYAKPVILRVFDREDWDEILEEADDGLLYKVLGSKKGKIYTIKFWQEIPDDWKDKWSDKMKEKIISGFKIN